MPLFHKTKVTISKSAVRNNIRVFRKLIGKKPMLMSVVKSNAYGHGIMTYAPFAEPFVDWFGVDSLAEARTLRQWGIKKPILVFGYTSPKLYPDAVKMNVSLSFFNSEEKKFLKKYPKLKIHVKVDTGMHRQGVYAEEIPLFIRDINPIQIQGVYTHFAGATDPKFKPYTLMQIENFKKASAAVQSKVPNVIRHACGTSATINYPDAHFDMVRVGAGMYGIGLAGSSKLGTRPILGWTSVIAQVKQIRAGSFIGYDLTEHMFVDCKVAVVPIGYWHGIARNLSRIGQVLIDGKRAKFLGIVSMDAMVVEIPTRTNVKVGDRVTIIGSDGKEKITVREIAQKRGTVDSEVTTCINPLIPRVLVK
jgi:alanine racemase